MAIALVSGGSYRKLVQFKTLKRVKCRSPNDAPQAHDNNVVAKMEDPKRALLFLKVKLVIHSSGEDTE